MWSELFFEKTRRLDEEELVKVRLGCYCSDPW